MGDEVKTTTETTTEHNPGGAPETGKKVETTETTETKTTEETPREKPVTTETQTKNF